MASSNAPAPPRPDRTTEDLVHAARGGDPEAFGRLVERYEARVRAAALALGLDLASAEDVAQDAFVAAHAGLGGLREPGAFPSWIVGIARHRALSLLRRKGLAPAARDDLDRLPRPDPDADPAAALERRGAAEEVRRALARLDDRERLAMTLRHHAGLTYAEIAETMTLPTSTIKGLLYRGTRALRDLLGASGGVVHP